MIFLGIIASVAAIGFFCWLLFTLAVFALPFFAGITAGSWAYHTGAGWLGAFLVGMVGAGATLGSGRSCSPSQARSGWLADRTGLRRTRRDRGLHATHGIVKHPCRRRPGRSRSRLSEQSRLASRHFAGRGHGRHQPVRPEPRSSVIVRHRRWTNQTSE
jgi:hypothetical protein